MFPVSSLNSPAYRADDEKAAENAIGNSSAASVAVALGLALRE